MYRKREINFNKQDSRTLLQVLEDQKIMETMKQSRLAADAKATFSLAPLSLDDVEDIGVEGTHNVLGPVFLPWRYCVVVLILQVILISLLLFHPQYRAMSLRQVMREVAAVEEEELEAAVEC